MTTEAVIFDFDGVLVDTERLHLRALQAVLAPLGLRLDERDYFERYLGYSDRDLLQALAAEHRLPAGARDALAVIDAKSGIYSALLCQTDPFFSGARAAVVRLRRRWPLAIASGSFRGEIEALLASARLTSFFAAVVGADDVAAHKPSPQPYIEAARRLGVDPRASVAIEDSRWGLDAARAAGCATIAVTHTYPRAVLQADAIVDSLDELTPAFVAAVRRR
jgi:beta-phosphoglucomutase